MEGIIQRSTQPDQLVNMTRYVRGVEMPVILGVYSLECKNYRMDKIHGSDRECNEEWTCPWNGCGTVT